jgi:hypothetical protein
MEQTSDGIFPHKPQRSGATANQLVANYRAAALAPTIRGFMAAGFISYQALADELNRRRIPTPLGGSWHRTTIVRMVARLGLTTSDNRNSGRTSKPAANVRAEAFSSTIQNLRKAGFVSVSAVARELNRRGITTPQGAMWRLTTVSRLLERLDRLDRGSGNQHRR